MKGERYSCIWLEPTSNNGGQSRKRSPTEALWIPDAKILIQWIQPNGTMQITRRDSFPPEPQRAWVRLVSYVRVPVGIFQLAERYLKKEAHNRAQLKVMQLAQKRLMSGLISIQNQLKTAVREELVAQSA